MDKASVPAGLHAKSCKMGSPRMPPLPSHPRTLSSICIFFVIYCFAFIGTEVYASCLPQTPPCCRPRSAPSFRHCYSAVSFLSQIKGFVHLSLMKFQSPFLTEETVFISQRKIMTRRLLPGSEVTVPKHQIPS